MEDTCERLRHFLCENGALQPAGEELVRNGIARAEQLVVRVPTDTQPILLDGSTTAAMLSDSSDNDGKLGEHSMSTREGPASDVPALDNGKLHCPDCNMFFNSKRQKKDHYDSPKHKRKIERNTCPNSGSPAAGKQPERKQPSGFKGIEGKKNQTANMPTSDVLASSGKSSNDTSTATPGIASQRIHNKRF